MIYESGSEYHQPNIGTVSACDEAMRELHERAFFEGGMEDTALSFIRKYQPQTLESFIPIMRLTASLVDYMHEPGDDDLVLNTILVRGIVTGLMVTNETYDGVMDIDDTLQSIAALCTSDEQNRKNINQLVDKAKAVILLMPKEMNIILQDWRTDCRVAAGHEDVFNVGFAIVLAGAHEKAIQRQMEIEKDFDWDSLLGGEQ